MELTRMPKPGDIVQGTDFSGQLAMIVVKSLRFEKIRDRSDPRCGQETENLDSIHGYRIEGKKQTSIRAGVNARRAWKILGQYQTLDARIRALETGHQLWVGDDEYALPTVRTMASRIGMQTNQRYEVVIADGGAWVHCLGARSQSLAAARRISMTRASEPVVRLSVYIPPDAHARVVAEKQRTGKTMARVVADLITAALPEPLEDAEDF